MHVQIQYNNKKKTMKNKFNNNNMITLMHENIATERFHISELYTWMPSEEYTLNNNILFYKKNINLFYE